MLIRQARQRDIGDIAAIYNHYVRLGGSSFDVRPWTAQQTGQMIADSSDEVWVVACPDAVDQRTRVVGWASARRFSARFGYRFSLETAVYVHPGHQRCGVGLALMRAVLDQCRQRSIHYLMARIISDNEASLRFHRQLGFETVGVQKEVGRMNDQWLDVTLLQKLL